MSTEPTSASGVDSDASFSPGTSSKFYRRLKQFFGDYPATTISSTVILVSLLFALWRLTPSIGGNVATNQLLVVLGMILGWLIGLFAAPFTEIDRKDFSALGQAIYAFVTGYLVSKIDRFLERMLFRDGKEPVELVWKQAALFAGVVVTAALLHFTWRRYAFQKARTRQVTPSTEQDLQAPSAIGPARPA